MYSLTIVFADGGTMPALGTSAAAILAGLVALFVVAIVAAWLTVRHIPNQQVGVVEKLWSRLGSVKEGRIIALDGEAGYQADLLRGGLHFGLWRWQYRVHKVPLVTIPQGQIGYVYARDGDPLPPSQTLGRVVVCNNYQDARSFLGESHDGSHPAGQRGRQRGLLREGVYAINPALFVVITEDAVSHLPHLLDEREAVAVAGWHQRLKESGGFRPLVVGGPVTTADPIHPDKAMSVDSIGIVTVHDGPSLPVGEIIAPAVGTDASDANYHNNYQDPEAFLRAGGRRGRQYAPLTDGTYFLNRWFATVEVVPKTVVPIGHVGVVVSYYGRAGRDVSGDAFRHGERVSEGERGVWERPLGPGKYPFNTYAGQVILVPTTNFVLHWITGKTESHRFDESLRSIDLVTRDAYEPMLPLSVVVHIDYQRAPSVIQRFGDVKKLITQTLDPMLSAYFRDIAHKKTMLELLHERDAIQTEARIELRNKFREFDIECVDVLIGKPGTEEAGGKIETLLEQLRLRQLSIEQQETYERQRAAAEKLRTLNEAQAQAAMQTQMTNAKAQVQIAESAGEADLARARKQAEQAVVAADADLARARRHAEQTVLTAEAEARKQVLAGRGEGQKAMQIGLAEATVLLRKAAAFGDPRLYALSLVAERLAHSTQPLVPERVFVAGANGEPNGSQGMLGMLLNLLVAEKTGFPSAESGEIAGLRDLGDRLTREAVDSLNQASTNGPAAAGAR
ncbi:MAG TPA: SPFH domain-containing protein [Gemmataceae bacterium]|nr:SPFH domain-containing protein [Gemmataceae bacterium]